jgi:hypothetical protein
VRKVKVFFFVFLLWNEEPSKLILGVLTYGDDGKISYLVLLLNVKVFPSCFFNFSSGPAA